MPLPSRHPAFDAVCSAAPCGRRVGYHGITRNATQRWRYTERGPVADPESGPVGSLDPSIVNVNGGAIALGHPVGATGGRLVLTMLYEMARRNASLGLVTLCVGGGQGGAMVLERS